MLLVSIPIKVLTASNTFGTPDTFGIVEKEEKGAHNVNNICLFKKIEDFKKTYPDIIIKDNLLDYKFEYLVVTENPIDNYGIIKNNLEKEKFRWKHDTSLIDYLEIGYLNQNSEIIKIHYKDAAKSFIPQLKDYNVEKIKIEDKIYSIYNDGNSIEYIVFEDELFGKIYNIHVEILKLESNGSCYNKYESINNINNLFEFLQSLSLDKLIKVKK